jgi:glutathione S-transferase
LWIKVYKAGFATSQKAYEEAVIPLFDGLDRIEKILSDGRDYLVGGRLTEADVRWVPASWRHVRSLIPVPGKDFIQRLYGLILVSIFTD